MRWNTQSSSAARLVTEQSYKEEILESFFFEISDVFEREQLGRLPRGIHKKRTVIHKFN
jgi:hypothetical protein